MKTRINLITSNKKGAILPIVLLIAVGIIAMLVILVTAITTEMRIVGNRRAYMTELYQIESAVNYIENNFDDVLSKTELSKVGDTGSIKKEIWTAAGVPETLTGTIKYDSEGVAERNSGNSAIHTRENSFIIKVESPNKSNIEVGIDKTSIKPDD